MLVTSTTISVMIPPNTTDGTKPMILAVTPDSNSPISFDEPMNMLLTAETRPFISFGVFSWKIVLRTQTLIPSKAPLMVRIKSDK